MRAEDLLDAIGYVEDSYIGKAKEKPKTTKKLWAVLGVVAACAALIIGIPVMYATSLITGSDSIPGSDNMSGNKGNGQKAAVSKIEVYRPSNKIIAVVDMITHDSPETTGPIVELVDSIMDSRKGTAYPVTDSNDDMDPEDIIIVYLDNGGNLIVQYRLNGNTLFDCKAYVKYALFDAEVELLTYYLGIEE